MRGFGRHVDGADDYLTGACLCISRGAPGRPSGRSTRSSSSTTRTSSGACAPARSACRSRSRSTRTRRHSGGASSGGGEGETWAYYSTRNRLWLLEAAARRARCAPRGVRTRMRARVRARATGAPRRRTRQACGRARLVRAPHGAGPVAAAEGRVRRRLPGADARGHGAPRRRPARRAAGARRRRADRARRSRVAGARVARPEARRAAAGSRAGTACGSPRRRARPRRTSCTARRSAARCAMPGMPTVVTVHDLAVLREPSWFPAWSRNYGRALMPRAVRNADRVICVSRATARDAVGLLDVPYRKLRVIPNAIGAGVLDPARARRRSSRRTCSASARPSRARTCPRCSRRSRSSAAPAGACGWRWSAPTAGATCASARPRASSPSAASTTASCATSTRTPRRSCCRASGRASGCRSPRRSPRAAASPAPTSRRCASSPARTRRISTPSTPEAISEGILPGAHAAAPDAAPRDELGRRRGVGRRALARAPAVSAEPLVLVDADTVGRGRTGDESYTVNLLRELPAAAPELAFACLAARSVRPAGGRAGRRAAPAARRREPLPAHPVRVPGARPARVGGARAPALLRLAAPALPGRRDGARHLLRPRAGAVLEARPLALPLRARVAAPRGARDRSLGVHARRRHRPATASIRARSSRSRTASSPRSGRWPRPRRACTSASASTGRTCSASARCSRARTCRSRSRRTPA